MDSLLSAIKTNRNQEPKSINSVEEQENGLTVRTTSRINNIRPAIATPKDKVEAAISLPQRTELSLSQSIPSTPQEALTILRSQPDATTLLATLQLLVTEDAFNPSFNLATTGGHLQAQIIHTLLTTTVPDFWTTDDESLKPLLVDSLSNLTGSNAAVALLRSLGNGGGDGGRKAEGKEAKAGAGQQRVKELLEVANRLFRGKDAALRLLQGLEEAKVDCNDGGKQSELARKELIALLGSGKVGGAVAQAEMYLHTASLREGPSWLGSGALYAKWLGQNIATLLLQPAESHADFAAQLLAKALNLGYTGALIGGLVGPLVRKECERQYDVKSHGESESEAGTETNGNIVAPLVTRLPAYTKRRFLEEVLRWLGELVGSDGPSLDDDELEVETTAGESKELERSVAAFLQWLVKGDVSIAELLSAILSDPPLNSFLPYQLRRACVATLSHSVSRLLAPLLEKTIRTFSDPLFIARVPIAQQESVAQTLLLTAGHLHNQSNGPATVLKIARSAGHMQGTSNRLNASGTRARWLGMIVAMGVSRLVDKEGQRMNFDTEDMQTVEAKWYLGVVMVEAGGIQERGSLREFAKFMVDQDGKQGQTASKDRKREMQRTPEAGKVKTKQEVQLLNGKPVFGPVRPPAPAQTEIVGSQITELFDGDSDGDGDDDDDLKPYAKPDDDPEDSDEDATLVNRNKVRAPVYIRDLMRMLLDDKNPETSTLALKTAAGLIRRKTGFGKEVSDHAEELLSTLCNLQDQFEAEDFDELRLQALIAMLVSDMAQLGPWMSRQVFAGEYSIAVRCVMLTALGLGGRELAGVASPSLEEQDQLNPKVKSAGDFPTKRLPGRLHELYTPNSAVGRLEAASKSVEQTMMGPLALQAADKQTAHLNAVKVRTFSSRLTADKRTNRKQPPNNLAKIFAKAIFSPLLGRYQREISAYGTTSVFSSAPVLLTTLLKTAALLLHASGPATLHLSELTSECFGLLLSLRVRASSDISVLEAVLFSLLTVLEVNNEGNGRQRLLQDNGREIEEIGNWVGGVFERFEGLGSGEEEKVRMLAAGVLVRIREVLEEGRGRMFGPLGL